MRGKQPIREKTVSEREVPHRYTIGTCNPLHSTIKQPKISDGVMYALASWEFNNVPDPTRTFIIEV